MKTNEKNASEITDNQIKTTKTSFPVLNMHCAACAVSVENRVKQIPGVALSNVNFATSTLTVAFDLQKVTPEQIQKEVQSIGFDIILGEKTEQDAVFQKDKSERWVRLKRDTLWAAIFSFPLFIIGMFFMNIRYADWIMWGLATPVLFIFGRSFFVNAWKQALQRMANMDTLVALSTGVAYTFSVFNTLFPETWTNRGLESHVYFEASAVIITFILLGKLLEERAKGNTSTAIKKLMGLQPSQVTVLHDDQTQVEIPIQELAKGMRVIIKPGDKISVDGTVSDGESYVDESSLTGESVAVLKQTGSKVFAGTINQKGSFQFMAEKVGEETLLAHIIQTVQDAQGSKAPVQKLADKIAGVFVPIVLGIGVITFSVWAIWGGNNGISQGLLSMITVLVIACPCALGLATPTAIMVGLGKGAKNGILIKDAESLELSKKIDCIVLDKTGTITEGKPVVSEIFWTRENNMAKSILVSMEAQSEHPLAEAVVEFFHDASKVGISKFESITGKGAQSIFSGIYYYVGNQSLMVEKGLIIEDQLLEKAEEWRLDAQTVIWFGNSEKVLGIIAISDQIKPTSKEAIFILQKAGIEIIMLTGDHQNTAKSIAQQVGIEHFKASLLPHEKADYIRSLQKAGKIVAMVGDGINDSVALAQADVSIAMGQGSDIAMDVAKMTIISSDLMKVPEAIFLSQRTVKIIKQNLFWAFIYNLIGIPLAAGVLFPFFGFLLNPMIAGAAMALSSVSVVTNSLRLR